MEFLNCFHFYFFFYGIFPADEKKVRLESEKAAVLKIRSIPLAMERYFELAFIISKCCGHADLCACRWPVEQLERKKETSEWGKKWGQARQARKNR